MKANELIEKINEVVSHEIDKSKFMLCHTLHSGPIYSTNGNGEDVAFEKGRLTIAYVVKELIDRHNVKNESE